MSLSAEKFVSAGTLTGLDDGSQDKYPESLIKDSNSTDEKQKPGSSNKEDTSKVKAPSKVKLTSAKNGKGKKLTVKWKIREYIKVKQNKSKQMYYNPGRKCSGGNF